MLGQQRPVQVPAPQTPQVKCQYTFSPRYLSFQGAVKPQRAFVQLKDGMGAEQRTQEYWIIPGPTDPRYSRDVSSLEDAPPQGEDCNVAFTAETFSGQVGIDKAANGSLGRREIVIEILVSKDANSPYQILKQVNMNLPQFLDTGKIDDVISFQDISVLFVFEMEVTTAFSKQQLFQQQALAPQPILPPPVEAPPKEQPPLMTVPNPYTQL